MDTCDRCNGWFDPAEGARQPNLFSGNPDLALCPKCFDETERAAHAAMRATFRPAEAPPAPTKG